MRDGYLRGVLSTQATRRQMDVLAAYVAAGGSVHDAAELVGIRPSTVKRHLADLRARSGLTTEQLIYVGRAAGWLVVPTLEPAQLNVGRTHGQALGFVCHSVDSDDRLGKGQQAQREAGATDTVRNSGDEVVDREDSGNCHERRQEDEVSATAASTGDRPDEQPSSSE